MKKINTNRTQLREGVSTGSCACAAALAALEYLVTGKSPATVTIPLPPITHDKPRAWLTLAVARCGQGNLPDRPYYAKASVIKNAGDDPDVTHGAEIVASLRLFPRAGTCASIRITGAKGVGKITLPGLPLPVGAWAINPVPRQQIRFALRQRWRELTQSSQPSMCVTISVPDGERLALKTFNPRLGIVGGLSILGTHGTVKAFSHAAFAATIAESVSVAKALGLSTLYCSTGRRSERLLQQCYPKAPLQAFVQAADFVAYTLLQAHRAGFAKIIWGCFFGKLVKLAQGHGQTHAKRHSLDFTLLAQSCALAGPQTCRTIKNATTAAEVLELLLAHPQGPAIIDQLTQKASQAASHFARQPVEVHLFHLDGRKLAVFPKSKGIPL